MKISVIIPHYPFNEEINQTLKKCVDSLSGYDELIVVVNEGTGFAKAVNQGLKLAKGDYIMVVNNDIEWVYGDLKDLCREDSVTSPMLNGDYQAFWGCFFSMPKSVYERIGGFDEQFEVGYYEDDDYIKRLDQANIPMTSIHSCGIKSKGGQTMGQFDKEAVVKANKERFDKKWS